MAASPMHATSSHTCCADEHATAPWSSSAFEQMLDANCAACVDPSWLESCRECEDAAAEHSAGMAPLSCEDRSACNACEVLPAAPAAAAASAAALDEAAFQQLLACCCCSSPEQSGRPQPKHYLCEWRECNRYFHSHGDLAHHVNQSHLGLPDVSTGSSSRSSSLAPVTPHISPSTLSTVPQRCKWDDCDFSFRPPDDGSSQSIAFFQHILSDHLQADPSLVSPFTTLSAPMLPDGPSTHSIVHTCRWEGCSRVFGSTGDLMTHVTDDHIGSGKPTYICAWEGCARAEEGRVFSQRQKVLRHMQTHTGDRPYTCPLCHKAFAEQTTLQQHHRTHTKERPFECIECGKHFALASALTIHMRTHTGDKPFVCPHERCGAAFAESSNLRKHLRIHSGDRPFRCPVETCGKAFQRSDQLNRHLKTHSQSVM